MGCSSSTASNTTGGVKNNEESPIDFQEMNGTDEPSVSGSIDDRSLVESSSVFTPGLSKNDAHKATKPHPHGPKKISKSHYEHQSDEVDKNQDLQLKLKPRKMLKPCPHSNSEHCENKTLSSNISNSDCSEQSNKDVMEDKSLDSFNLKLKPTCMDDIEYERAQDTSEMKLKPQKVLITCPHVSNKCDQSHEQCSNCVVDDRNTVSIQKSSGGFDNAFNHNGDYNKSLVEKIDCDDKNMDVKTVAGGDIDCDDTSANIDCDEGDCKVEVIASTGLSNVIDREERERLVNSNIMTHSSSLNDEYHDDEIGKQYQRDNEVDEVPPQENMVGVDNIILENQICCLNHDEDVGDVGLGMECISLSPTNNLSSDDKSVVLTHTCAKNDDTNVTFYDSRSLGAPSDDSFVQVNVDRLPCINHNTNEEMTPTKVNKICEENYFDHDCLKPLNDNKSSLIAEDAYSQTFDSLHSNRDCGFVDEINLDLRKENQGALTQNVASTDNMHKSLEKYDEPNFIHEEDCTGGTLDEETLVITEHDKSALISTVPDIEGEIVNLNSAKQPLTVTEDCGKTGENMDAICLQCDSLDIMDCKSTSEATTCSNDTNSTPSDRKLKMREKLRERLSSTKSSKSFSQTSSDFFDDSALQLECSESESFYTHSFSDDKPDNTPITPSTSDDTDDCSKMSSPVRNVNHSLFREKLRLRLSESKSKKVVQETCGDVIQDSRNSGASVSATHVDCQSKVIHDIDNMNLNSTATTSPKTGVTAMREMLRQKLSNSKSGMNAASEEFDALDNLVECIDDTKAEVVEWSVGINSSDPKVNSQICTEVDSSQPVELEECVRQSTESARVQTESREIIRCTTDKPQSKHVAVKNDSTPTTQVTRKGEITGTTPPSRRTKLKLKPAVPKQSSKTTCQPKEEVVAGSQVTLPSEVNGLISKFSSGIKVIEENNDEECTRKSKIPLRNKEIATIESTLSNDKKTNLSRRRSGIQRLSSLSKR